jgi:hypothetical protein
VNLGTRLDRLEALLASQPRPEREYDLSEEELDARMEWYVSQRNEPGFERVEWLEWVCKSNGWETPEDLERSRKWTANMNAGFPRKWVHVQKPNGRWSWAWADELEVAS